MKRDAFLDSTASSDELSPMTFGVHMMFDGYEADPEKLADDKLIAHLLTEIPRSLGMHTICAPVVTPVGPQNRKDPGGVSGIVMIAESHLSFHTFPARGFITVDLYTCQETLDQDRLVELLKAGFEVQIADVSLAKRGVRYPGSDIYPNNPMLRHPALIATY